MLQTYYDRYDKLGIPNARALLTSTEKQFIRIVTKLKNICNISLVIFAIIN